MYINALWQNTIAALCNHKVMHALLKPSRQMWYSTRVERREGVSWRKESGQDIYKCDHQPHGLWFSRKALFWDKEGGQDVMEAIEWARKSSPGSGFCLEQVPLENFTSIKGVGLRNREWAGLQCLHLQLDSEIASEQAWLLFSFWHFLEGFVVVVVVAAKDKIVKYSWWPVCGRENVIS